MTKFFYITSWIMGSVCIAVAFIPPFNDKSAICLLVGGLILVTNRKP